MKQIQKEGERRESNSCFSPFSMDTGCEYVYTILQFKVQIRLFHIKKMQIKLYLNLEKIPYFQG